MSITYNASTNFGAKDALPVNDPDKVIYGAEFTTEFTAITAAFGNAAPTASPTFTGTATFSGDVALNGAVTISGSSITLGTETLTDTDIQNWDATKATVDAGAAGWDATKATVDAGAAGWDATEATVNAGASSWDAAYGDKINSAAFNTSNGVLTLTQQDGGTVTTDLDGRYSTTDTNTTYSGGTNITLSGTTFNLDSSISGLTDVTTSAVSIGNWEIRLDGNDLRFIYAGTDRIRFTTSGAIIAENNVTAYGSA